MSTYSLAVAEPATSDQEGVRKRRGKARGKREHKLSRYFKNKLLVA